jgi:hypothetical protein
MPHKEPPSTSALLHRIETLEMELSRRPTRDQIQYVTEYARRQKKLYETVLARNVVLKRRLDEVNT